MVQNDTVQHKVLGATRNLEFVHTRCWKLVGGNLNHKRRTVHVIHAPGPVVYFGIAAQSSSNVRPLRTWMSHKFRIAIILPRGVLLVDFSCSKTHVPSPRLVHSEKVAHGSQRTTRIELTAVKAKVTRSIVTRNVGFKHPRRGNGNRLGLHDHQSILCQVRAGSKIALLVAGAKILQRKARMVRLTGGYECRRTLDWALVALHKRAKAANTRIMLALKTQIKVNVQEEIANTNVLLKRCQAVSIPVPDDCDSTPKLVMVARGRF